MKKVKKVMKLNQAIASTILSGLFITISFLSLGQQKGEFISNGRAVNISAFDIEVQKMIEEVGIAGVSIAIIEGNEVVYTNAYGLKDKKNEKEINDKTIFEAASLTKIFLVYVVNKLVDEGRFDLDKPMYQYLANEDLAADERYKLITPRMIMSHSSGIENWKRFNDEEVLEILADPGTEFVYSGEGYEYLARVIEKELDMTYAEYVQKMVIKPLKLDRTYTQYAEKSFLTSRKKAKRNYAVGNDDFGGTYEKWKNTETVAASGVHLTSEGMATLLVEMFNGENLSSATIQAIQQGQIPLPFAESTEEMSFSCGLGFFQLQNANDSMVAFSGVNSGFRSEIFYSSVNDRGFVLFTNNDRGAMIVAKLNDMTADLDIDAIFPESNFAQYPSEFISLQRMYNDDKVDELIVKIGTLRKDGGIDQMQIDELISWISMDDEGVAKKIKDESSVKSSN